MYRLCARPVREQHAAATHADARRVVARPGRTGWPPRRLTPGQATVFDLPFGDYLASGVHRMQLSLYAGDGGAEIWLQP